MAEGARHGPPTKNPGTKHKFYHPAFLAVLAAACLCPLDEKLSLVLAGLTGFTMLSMALLAGSREKAQKNLSVEDLVRLAKFESGLGQNIKAERYYCRAIFRLVSAGDVSRGAALFEEYFMLCRRVFAPRIQLELCRELCREEKYLMAARSLEKLIEIWPRQFHHCDPKWLEQAYLRLARIYSESLGLPARASDCYFALLDKFPRSAFRETALFQLQVLDQTRRMAG